MKGADILNADNVEANSVDTTDVNASGTVSAGTVSAPSGAITNLNTAKTLIQNPPSGQADGTNKLYVDAKDDDLQSQISSIESDVAELKGAGSSGTKSIVMDFPSGYSCCEWSPMNPRLLSLEGFSSINTTVINYAWHATFKYAMLRLSFSPAISQPYIAYAQITNSTDSSWTGGGSKYAGGIGPLDAGFFSKATGEIAIVKKEASYIEIPMPAMDRYQGGAVPVLKIVFF